MPATGCSLSGGYYGSFYRNEYGSLNPVGSRAACYNPLGALLPLSAGSAADPEPAGGAAAGQPGAPPGPDRQLRASRRPRCSTSSWRIRGPRRTRTSPRPASPPRRPASRTWAARWRPPWRRSASPRGRCPSCRCRAICATKTGTTTRRWRCTTSEGTSHLHQPPAARTGTCAAKAQAAYQFTQRLPRHAGRGLTSRSTAACSRPPAPWPASPPCAQETEETGVRAELRRRMSENLSGAVSVETQPARRLQLAAGQQRHAASPRSPTPAPSAPVSRTASSCRRWRTASATSSSCSADWQPNDKLCRCSSSPKPAGTGSRSPSSYGLREPSMNSVGLDCDLRDQRQMEPERLRVARPPGSSIRRGPDAAIMAFDNTATTLGVGFTGKPTGKLEVGGTLAFINDRSEYAQTLDATAGAGSAALLAATGGLPDIVFRQTTPEAVRQVHAGQAVRGAGRGRAPALDAGTTGPGATTARRSSSPTARPSIASRRQNVSFIGVTYIYRWQ